jgi:hypothetical protein
VIVSATVVDSEQMISKWGLGGLMNAWFLFADRLREK